MKDKRKNTVKLFNSRNRWARRGRNLAEFLMSFLFVVVIYFLKIIYAGANWILISISFCAKIFFEKNSVKVKNEKQKPNDEDNEILPDRFTRMNALLEELKDKPIVDKLSIGSIIDMTVGCSKYDLSKIVEEARKTASIRGGHNGNSLICEQDLIMATQKINSVA
jgi:hypothetical protein